MKVTLNTDGSVTFDVATAAEATALARELQNGTHNGNAVQAVVEAAACDREEAVLIEAEADEDDEAVAEYVRTAVAEAEAAPKRPSDYAIKQAAARAAGLSVQHYLVWEYLVDKDSQRGGVSVDQTMRKFRISRGAATQRLALLARKNFATRCGRGHYRAATP